MELELIRDLRSAGKLHRRLLIRIVLLAIIAFVLLLVSVYQVVRFDLNIWFFLVLLSVGFFLGLKLFSKMNTVVWDDEKEVITTGRMDIVGVFIVLLYVLFEVTLRNYLQTEYAGTIAATSYLFATISASLAGRTVSTIFAITKVVRKESIDLS